MNHNKLIYAGSYCEGDKPGIHVYRINDQQQLIFCGEGSGVENPSYLASSLLGKFLYSVSEVISFNGDIGGAVAAFVREGYSLRLLNVMQTKETLPCHLLVNNKRKYLYVANYMGGSVSMFSIMEDGSIGGLCDLKQHFGDGPNKERQEGPHTHYLGFSSDEKGLWCIDLGIDTIKYYKIDQKNSKLIPEKERDIYLPKGTGARHFVVNKFQKELMFVICELSSEILAVRCTVNGGIVQQRISTLPEQTLESTCAAIKLSEDGRFLYASNRGDDSIAVFSIAQTDGMLTLIEIVKTHGKTPRDFLLCNELLISANQDSNSLTIFRVDLKTGQLKYSGYSISCKEPVCLIETF